MKGPFYDNTQSPALLNFKESKTTSNKTIFNAIRIVTLIFLSVCSVQIMLGQTITTGAVVGPFCAGSKVNVPYVYSGGTITTSTVFTAQLSNSSGSFASPVNIGTWLVTNTTLHLNWTVPATIPATIIEATGYRVRVISSNPSVIGSINSTPITLYEIYTGNQIFLETNGTGSGSVTAYESSNSFDNDGFTMSATTTSISANTGNPSSGYTGASGGTNILFNDNGSFTISGVNTTAYTQMGLGFGIMKNNSSSNASHFTIDVSANGTTWIPLTYTPLPTGGGTNNTWYYRVATGAIPSTTNLRIRFTRASGTAINLDDIELANAVSPATVALSPNTPQQICNSGGSVLLTATNVANAIYSWTGGGSANTKNVTSSGNYSVTTSDLFGCAVTRGPVNVTTSNNIAPSVSISSNQGNSICAGTNVTFTATPTYGGSNPSYQWKVNGSNVGTNSATYSTSSLTNGQTVTVVMTSNLSCANPNSATSSAIAMTVTAQPTWYLDADDDNYYTGSGITQCVSPGAGYKSAGLIAGNDCDDSDNSIWQSANLYTDNDGDGYTVGAAQSVCYGASIPAGYSVASAGSDCDDNDNTKWQSANLYTDNDGDGYTIGSAQNVCYGASIPAGYSLTSSGTDCDDNDNTKWQSANLYTDNDGDGYTVGTAQNVCYGASIPAGYSVTSLGTDCNDNNNTQWQSANLYTDNDGDGYTVGATLNICYGASIPAGYSLTTAGSDCNDNNNMQWQSANLYTDNDGDGYTVGAAQVICYGASIPAGYSATSLGTDCADNNAFVNPAASESCGNGIDDDCDGFIDENCSSAPANDIPSGAIMIANSGNSFPSCGLLSGTHINATNSPESVGYNGNDVWYKFVAISSGIEVTLNGLLTDNVVMLFNSSLNQMPGNSAINSNGNGGKEVLTYIGLTPGQMYYLSVGTVSGGGQFNLCFKHLAASFCADGSTTYSLCSNLKPQWTGANSYTFHFTPTGSTAGAPFSHTANGQLPLSTPSLGIVYGGTYNVVIDANYNNLLDGSNNPIGPVTIPGIITSNITIAPHATMIVRENQSCPATLLRGSILVGKPFVCSAVNFTVEFTKVSNCTGNVAVGMPFEVTTSGGSSNLNLSFSGPNQISNQSFYKVRWRPNFAYGSGTYGTESVIFIGGSAMETEPAFAMAETSSEKLMVEAITAGIYPNPNNGELVNLNITNLQSEKVQVRVLDAMGKVVFNKSFAVDGSLNTMINFAQPLSNGLYMVEFTSGNEVITERLMVTR